MLHRSTLRRLLAGLCLALGLAPMAMCTAQAQSKDTAAVATQWVDLHGGSRVRLHTLSGKSDTKVNGALELEIAEGWKTYWRMPGDAGVPPQIEWDKSDNVRTVEVLYPAPQRIAEPAAETIGYKHKVVFPLVIEAKVPGTPTKVRLELEIGLCKDICVPAEAKLEAEIATSNKPMGLPDFIREAWKAVPQPAGQGEPQAPKVLRMDAQLAGPAPRLLVEARTAGRAEAADLFIEAPESIYVPMTKKVSGGAPDVQRFEAALTPATAQDLKGKELTLTLVSEKGATEAKWKLP